MSAPTQIAHYRITGKLGEGGMGAVYRAVDEKLNREVAIKVLPPALAHDADYIARFQREAQTLAALNHPHIATIYGVEANAIVMELVEGSTLTGPMPLDEVLPIARQIAEALEAAHDKGIIHRDLKPGNIKLTPEGVVKVLDFGLAKAVNERPVVTGPDSPTLTLRATEAGLILGTAGYMSPEQAAGKTVDRRADIWSFGVVLYELLTGRRLFDGETVTHTLADVVRAPIELGGLPLRPLMERCLDRNLKTRLAHIGEARIAIERYTPETEKPAVSKPSYWPWAVAAVFAVAAGVALWAPWRSAPVVSEMRFQVPRARNARSSISPDGQRIAFAGGNGGISIREMNSLETRELPLARSVVSDAHFWSPDGRWIAYQSESQKLMKIPIDGGPPVALCDLQPLGSGAWSDDGVLLVSLRSGPLMRVPAAGGAPVPVTTLAKGQTEHWYPQFIGGDRFLYRASGEDGVAGIYAASLSDPAGKLVIPAGGEARDGNAFYYLPSFGATGGGSILYISQNVLLAQAVDSSSFERKGGPTAVLPEAGSFSASRNGSLVIIPSRLTSQGSVGAWRWVDRQGKEVPTAPPGGNGFDAKVSPSGKRWATSLNRSIWLYDMVGGAPSRFTFGPTDDRFFTWSPDDQWIAYASGQGRAHRQILRKNTLTSAAAEVVIDGGIDFQANDWSRDGRSLLYVDLGKSTGWDMWTLDMMTKGAKPVPYLQSTANERWGVFSPDGRWVAYTSDETQKQEVYVQSFPAGGGKFQISQNGGAFPSWRADGRELYFTSGQALMAVPIQSSPRFEAGTPRALIGGGLRGNGALFSVTPNGQRFLVPGETEAAVDVAPMTVIVNGQGGVKK